MKEDVWIEHGNNPMCVELSYLWNEIKRSNDEDFSKNRRRTMNKKSKHYSLLR